MKLRNRLGASSLLALGLAACGGGKTSPATDSAPSGPGQTETARRPPGAVLPFEEAPMGGKVGTTLQESVHKWREPARHLPKDAPNIVIVMLDDSGFGQASTFGGEIETPTLSRLADQGIV